MTTSPRQRWRRKVCLASVFCHHVDLWDTQYDSERLARWRHSETQHSAQTPRFPGSECSLRRQDPIALNVWITLLAFSWPFLFLPFFLFTQQWARKIKSSCLFCVFNTNAGTSVIWAGLLCVTVRYCLRRSRSGDRTQTEAGVWKLSLLWIFFFINTPHVW